MRPICAWSMWRRRKSGIRVAISSRPQPKRCGAFSCSRLGVRDGKYVAAIINAGDLNDVDVVAPATSEDTSWPCTRYSDQFQSVNPPAAELVKLRYFAGMTIPEAANSLAIFAPKGKSALGLRPSVDCLQN